MTSFAFTLPNRSGELASFADRLHRAGVNLLGLWGYAHGEELPHLSCVPESPDAFRKFARAEGLECEEGRTLYLIADDRPGALRLMLQRIADSGANVEAIECTSVGSRFGCFVWADDAHFDTLAQALA